MDDTPGPFEIVAEQDMARRLYELVEDLDEDKRQVVHLHYYEVLSLKQTALVLDIATSTVKYRLREALKVLRTQLTQLTQPINEFPKGLDCAKDQGANA